MLQCSLAALSDTLLRAEATGVPRPLRVIVMFGQETGEGPCRTSILHLSGTDKPRNGRGSSWKSSDFSESFCSSLRRNRTSRHAEPDDHTENGDK